ncbi:MAG: 2-hydroxy-acid oxidase, partial [Rhodospirillales bacterium]|nr:2-hydroxy-acid oxidase [Rhodospirillales bacterium]
AMISALTSSFEVSAAAHLPAAVAARSAVVRVSSSAGAVTAIRVEGPAPSVESRCASLKGLLAPSGDLDELHTSNSEILWREIRDAAFYWDRLEAQIWRVSVPPSEGARVAEKILQTLPGQVFYDWGGGLLWLALDPLPDAGCNTVRGALRECGGHATLIRAADDIRSSVAVFEPHSGPLGPLAARIKNSFDPNGVLNPGRMDPDW